MVDAMHLYLDDSGTRLPDRDRGRVPAHNHDWFGIGGVLRRERDEEVVRQAHLAFCREWNVVHPLHSAEIRASSKNFTWVNQLAEHRKLAFFDDLTALVTSAELVAIACVIDRPGYNHRYRERYGAERWLLCKTAFVVVVERSAKYARAHGCKLRIFVEKSDKRTDAMLRS